MMQELEGKIQVKKVNCISLFLVWMRNVVGMTLTCLGILR